MTAERFVAICEKAYARHMDRLLLEGLADCDLRRLLKARNSEHAEDFSEEEFIWLKEGLREATENLLRAACAVEWMRAASPPAFAWQQARGRLLVIHDRTALRLLRRRRISEAFLTRNMKHLLGASALQRNATSHICPPERLIARTRPLQETGRSHTAAAGGHLPGAVGRAVHLKVSQRRKVDNFAPPEMS